jgi:Uma2 family endonuclease
MPDFINEGLLSLEGFEGLPDDGWRTELVRGKVVREPPAGFEHGHLAARIGALLSRFVDEHQLGVVVGAETGFVLADAPPLVRAPDAAFVVAARLPPVTTRIKGFARLAPDLAVEVVSPSNTAAEIRQKVRDYLDAGTRVVWVLDPSDETVRVFRPGADPEVRRGRHDLDGDDVLPGLRISVAAVFARRPL